VVATAVDEQGGLWAADELGVWGVDGAGWSLRADGADAGVLRGLSPSGLGVVRLTSTNARTSELARIDVTGAVTGLASLERFEPLALAADPLRHRMFVLGSPLIERTTGLQSEGLVLATVFDGGAVLERVSVASTTETPAPADQVSLVRIDDQQLLVASNKGMRWLALDKRAPPAIAVRVDTTSLHIPPGAAVRAIRYSASGGADGVEGGLPSSGLDSAQWLDGQWFPSLPTTGRHVAPTSTPAALEFLETRPIWLRRLLRPRQSLGWALSARRSAVIESSRLSVGWVSVEVSYRSPP
jgi:hypothetical protein